MRAFRDLRDYIDQLTREIGPDEVRVIEGADWDLEIGCLSELLAEREGPALLFDGIPGYPKGFRVFTNAMGRRPAWAYPPTRKSRISCAPGGTTGAT